MKKLICVMAFAVIAAVIAIANPAPAADNGPPALSFAVANVSSIDATALSVQEGQAVMNFSATRSAEEMIFEVVNLDLAPLQATLAAHENCGWSAAHNVADGSFYNRAAMFDTDDTYGTHGMRDTGSQRGRAQQSPPA